jgi:predicted dienelactone hydrolase
LWQKEHARMTIHFIRRKTVWVFGCLLLMLPALVEGAVYDPLAVSPQVAPEILDLTVEDHRRQRDIPIRIYLPPAESPRPVVLFSHGLGGSREGSSYLGKHWAARRYTVVFLQHPGSDTSVWKDQPAAKRMAAMQEAASGWNFLLRANDIPAVLDQLEQWNNSDGHRLARRLNLTRVGMSGHSFGAVTTQAVSGQTTRGGATWFTQGQRTLSPLHSKDFHQEVVVPTSDLAFAFDAVL